MSLLSEIEPGAAGLARALAQVQTSGRPFALADVRVLLPDGSDAQPGSGAVGEVCVRGPAVFGGYAGRGAGAGADTFLPGGWFRTGDLALLREDGYLVVVDRAKDMMLVGGENVYAAEARARAASPAGPYRLNSPGPAGVHHA